MPHFARGVGGRQKQRSRFDTIAKALGLHPNNPDLAGARFSGGNAQKLVMGRWLTPDASIRVLLLDEPTQGVDVGARADIYRLLRDFTDQGGAVLVASSDPAEIAEIADRVLVLANGHPVAMLDDDIREDRLVQLAHVSSKTIAAQ